MSVSENVNLESSWCHDVTMPAGGGAHLDGLQLRGSKGFVMSGNNIDVPFVDYPGDGGWNVAVFLEGANGGNNDALIEGNWINGGNRLFNLTGSNMRVVNNKLGRDTAWGLLYPNSSPFYESGNVWMDTGQPVALQK